MDREPVQNSVLLGVLAQLEPFQAAIPENAFLALIRDDGQVRALVLQYSSWHGVHSAYADGMSDDDALAAFRLAVYEMRRKQVQWGLRESDEKGRSRTCPLSRAVSKCLQLRFEMRMRVRVRKQRSNMHVPSPSRCRIYSATDLSSDK